MTTNRIHLNEAVSGRTTSGTGLRRRAKLIAANVWGSTAYYPAEVLERDGANVFKTGVQMFENHLSESDKWERPEGDVGKLVGKLISDAAYDPIGDDGPGLYADVEFYESYGPRINEIANDIGLSVRASGLTEEAERDGRYGPVLVALLAAQSVDVVTRAGAGGKLTSILESDRNLAGRPVDKEGTQSVTDVTKEDFDALRTALVEAISGIPATLVEALKPAEVVEPELTDEEKAAEAAKAEEEKKPEVDGAAVLTAVAEAHLPAAVLPVIYAAIEKGTALEEAIKAQTDYRDALLIESESGTVVLKESEKVSGLSRAVTVLG